MIEYNIRLSAARNLILAIAVCTASVAGFPRAAWSAPRPVAELEEIREEISLLNLLRGLYLSRDQVQKISDLARQAQAMRDSAAGPFLNEKERILKTFSGLRDSLYLAPGAEKEAQEQAQKLDHEMKEAMGAVQDRISRMEEEVDGILTDAQACIVDDFKPCLVPPKDLRNPVRVGQANETPGALGKAADLIWAAPDGLWKTRGNKILETMALRLEEESGAMSGTMKADVRRRIGEIAARIRKTSDVDYAVKRGDLAKEFLLIDPGKALKQGHKKLGKNGRWLLSETAARILPRWLETMDAQGVPEMQEPADDAALRLDRKDIAARTLMQLQRQYRKRRESGALPPYDAFIKPVMDGINGDNLHDFLRGVRGCAVQLLEVRPDEDLVRLLAQLARGYAKWLELPLLNPKLDPFGLAADLETARQNADAAKACSDLLKLVDLLATFRKP